jgi:hypothetical protein
MSRKVRLKNPRKASLQEGRNLLDVMQSSQNKAPVLHRDKHGRRMAPAEKSPPSPPCRCKQLIVSSE